MNVEDDAEVYQIIVAMGENLVPDVCKLIMKFLECIHIEIGRQRWKEKMREVNMEYCAPLLTISISSCYSFPGLDKNLIKDGCYVTLLSHGRWFTFNCRVLGLGPDGYTSIFNRFSGNCRPVGTLPDNY
jgi:hypothetical protein